MVDRPIPFSAPMVRALLNGSKTQTRRICAWTNNPHTPDLTYIVPLDEPLQPGWFGDEEGEVQFFSGYAPGDRLWVRESYYQRGHWEPIEGAQTKGGRQKWAFIPADYFYTFDPPAEYRKGRHHKDPATVAWHKRLGRFMPRSFSRLTLTVTDVRVERLRDISETDCRAEGLERSYVGGLLPSYRGAPELDWRLYPDAAYRDLWNHINGPDAWEANPWVVAVTFTVGRHNIDAGALA